jgi:putative ABC transport system ATP-binding protein
MNTPCAVTLDGLSKRYGSGAQAVDVLSDVSLQVPAGEFLSIMGPSGSGKSTLLHLIAGFDVPDAGRVVIGGHDLARLSNDARSDLRLRRIGFVFQSFNLFPTFTVEENVASPLEFMGLGWREARQKAAGALALVGLEGPAQQRRPAELSGGEQQRVAIARALVTEPCLLLADEPTGNLDSRIGQSILDLLRTLNAERHVTVIMATHSTLTASYGHRVVELRDGRVVREARGTVTIMFSDIEGFTAMTERLGDQRAHQVLREHSAILREQIGAHGGFEVKAQGDGFMFAFPSARRALLCAVAIQRAIAAHGAGHADVPIRVRLGLHTGEAIKEGNDFFGRSVIVAARIAAAAQSGEILVSAPFLELADSAAEFTFDRGRDVELKGLSGRHRVFAVRWEAPVAAAPRPLPEAGNPDAGWAA